MLEVRLLGKFAVRVDGQPVELPLSAAQSLLAYLMLTAGTAHRRERLAGLLWPDMTEPSAKANLRHTLWRLRKALGERDYLLVDDLTVAFDATAEYWLDARVIGAKVEISTTTDELIRAASVYEGELLPGFYDEWAALERERLQAAFERKMTLLVERLAGARRWPEALEWGERWIALGGAPEPAYRALMLGHAGLGDLSAMAAAFQRCAEALRRELGVAPSEQTRALYERLARGESPPASPASIPFQNRYQLKEELSRGGMGVVYRAHDLLLDRPVAVKVLSRVLSDPERQSKGEGEAGLDAEGRARLLREAQAAARLNHPNIVSIYDAGENEGVPFVVMELVEGDALYQRNHCQTNLLGDGLVWGEIAALTEIMLQHLMLGELGSADELRPTLRHLLSDTTPTRIGFSQFLGREAMLARYRGDLAEALRALESARDEARRGGAIETTTLVSNVLAEADLEVGAVEAAVSVLQETLSLDEQHPIEGRDVWTLCLLCAARVREGDLPDAHRLLDEARAKAGPQPTPISRARLALAEARLAAAEGKWPDALAAFELTAQLDAQMGRRWYRAQALREWAEALLTRRRSPSGDNEPGDPERARELLLEAQAEFEAMKAPKYAAMVRERLQTL